MSCSEPTVCGPILGCQAPHCGSAVGALAHVIVRAFCLPLHSLPFTCSFVPFLLRCHRNVSQHFWCGCFLCCQLFSLLLLSCCYSCGNLILCVCSQGEQVPLGWDSCPPFFFLLGISCNKIPKNNQINNQQACNTHPDQTVLPTAWWAGIKYKFSQNSSWLKLVIMGHYDRGTLLHRANTQLWGPIICLPSWLLREFSFLLICLSTSTLMPCCHW